MLNIVTFDTTQPPTTWFLYMNGRHEEGLHVSLMSINKNVLQLLSKYVNKLLNFFLYFEASDFRVFIQIRAPIPGSGDMITITLE